MTEPTPGAPAPEKPTAEFKAITSQDDLDRIVKERLGRERAKFADYADVKAKAARLDEIEGKAKTEAERSNERMAALERELAETRTASMRSRVQAKHGIADEDAELFLTGTDEDTLTRQAERLAARNAEDRSKGNVVTHEGKTPNVTPGDADLRATARKLFGPPQG